jgi:hypothetical protein
VKTESQHIEENGVNESRFLELAQDMTNFDPNAVWVGDTGYVRLEFGVESVQTY